MFTRNSVHIHPGGAAELFDLEIFRVGASDTTMERGLSSAQVAARILAWPKTLEVLSFDPNGKPIRYHETIREEMRKTGRDFVDAPGTACGTCGGSGKVNSAPCPECRAPLA